MSKVRKQKTIIQKEKGVRKRKKLLDSEEPDANNLALATAEKLLDRTKSKKKYTRNDVDDDLMRSLVNIDEEMAVLRNISECDSLSPLEKSLLTIEKFTTSANSLLENYSELNELLRKFYSLWTIGNLKQNFIRACQATRLPLNTDTSSEEGPDPDLPTNSVEGLFKALKEKEVSIATATDSAELAVIKLRAFQKTMGKLKEFSAKLLVSAQADAQFLQTFVASQNMVKNVLNKDIRALGMVVDSIQKDSVTPNGLQFTLENLSSMYTPDASFDLSSSKDLCTVNLGLSVGNNELMNLMKSEKRKEKLLEKEHDLTSLRLLYKLLLWPVPCIKAQGALMCLPIGLLREFEKYLQKFLPTSFPSLHNIRKSILSHVFPFLETLYKDKQYVNYRMSNTARTEVIPFFVPINVEETLARDFTNSYKSEVERFNDSVKNRWHHRIDSKDSVVFDNIAIEWTKIMKNAALVCDITSMRDSRRQILKGWNSAVKRWSHRQKEGLIPTLLNSHLVISKIDLKEKSTDEDENPSDDKQITTAPKKKEKNRLKQNCTNEINGNMSMNSLNILGISILNNDVLGISSTANAIATENNDDSTRVANTTDDINMVGFTEPPTRNRTGNESFY